MLNAMIQIAKHLESPVRPALLALCLILTPGSAMATSPCPDDTQCGLPPVATVLGATMATGSAALTSFAAPAIMRALMPDAQQDYWSAVGWTALASASSGALAVALPAMQQSDDESLVLHLSWSVPLAAGLLTSALLVGLSGHEQTVASSGQDLPMIGWSATPTYQGVTLTWLTH